MPARTIVSWAFFSFWIIVFVLHISKHWNNVIKQILNIGLILILLSYSTTFLKTIQNNVITKRRDVSLTTNILGDIYKIKNFRNKKIFFKRNLESSMLYENGLKNIEGVFESNLFVYSNGDTNFFLSLLIYVSGINFEVVDGETKNKLEIKYANVETFKEGKRFVVFEDEGAIVIIV